MSGCGLAAERSALPSPPGQRQLVDLPLVRRARSPRDGAADDLDDLAHALDRAIEADAVPALDHLRPAHAEAEQEAAVRTSRPGSCAVMAISAGVRVPACMMPVPSRMREVRAAMKASGVTASWPHASRGPDAVARPAARPRRRRRSPAPSPRWPGGGEIATRIRRSGRGQRAGDLLELAGVVEVVQADEQQRLAPVERAEESDARSCRSSRGGGSAASTALEEGLAVALEQRPPGLERTRRVVVARPRRRAARRAAGRRAARTDAAAEVARRPPPRGPSPRWRSTPPAPGVVGSARAAPRRRPRGAAPSPPRPCRRSRPASAWRPAPRGSPRIRFCSSVMAVTVTSGRTSGRACRCRPRSCRCCPSNRRPCCAPSGTGRPSGPLRPKQPERLRRSRAAASTPGCSRRRRCRGSVCAASGERSRSHVEPLPRVSGATMNSLHEGAVLAEDLDAVVRRGRRRRRARRARGGRSARGCRSP